MLLALRSLGRDRQLLGSMANGRGGDMLALAALALVVLSIVGLAIALLA